ncbi:8-oxo-dGTP diphosphatase [Actinopolymorpha pittospori]|uniref:8-oxo-dGTP diphosphatase n=2 Tax=Actinopolymorpha pittospori TaxID=648752 RepID=A0A927MZU1_9ACTN|nr:8-oxo-dGTP diphosphatase [Actinopolymorpha pittospori]
MTNEAFARKLGIAVRTVGTWHSRPDLIPKTEMQQILDATLEQAPADARSRFGRLLSDINQPAASSTGSAGSPQVLRVAIAIVIRDDDVLIVCRRGDDAGGISWQFPAGVVKPGTSSGTTAVRETLSETGIHCAISQNLGTRLHPLTHVYCEYFLCDYLAGTAENRDVVENVDVTWVQRGDLTRFIPRDSIYPPVIRTLEGRHDTAAS